MLDVTLANLAAAQMAGGKDLLVAVEGTDDDGNPISYSVTSSNPNVTASVVTGGRSLRMNVSGIDANGDPFTGDLTLRLFEDLAPNTTQRIISLVENDFYNDDPATAGPDMIFHRIIHDFMIQGGDPTGTGSGGSDFEFDVDDEYDTSLTFTSHGLLAMAKAPDDGNDSQFFITDIDTSLTGSPAFPQTLNFQHTIFGIMTSGFETYEKLISVPTDPDTDRPFNPPSINSVEVFTDDQNGVIRISAPEGFTGTADITVTADSGVGEDAVESFPVQVLTDTVNDRAFLGDVPAEVTTPIGTPVTFEVEATDLEEDQLFFDIGVVEGSAANVTTDIQVTQADGTNPAKATITLTPVAGFIGEIGLRLRVTDLSNPASAPPGIDPFDTQVFTLSVANGKPVAEEGSVETEVNTEVEFMLPADDGDPGDEQALTYVITSFPSTGTLSLTSGGEAIPTDEPFELPNNTNTLFFTPATDFTGAEDITFFVMDDGGTTNGGDDRSNEANFRINVVEEGSDDDVPTGLDLVDASDNGLFNDDDYTSVSTPTLTVNAEPGSTVVFHLNGINVPATETSSGVFSVTLARDQLQVGANVVTATSNQNGTASDPSDQLLFVYAPDYSQAYTVPGAPGTQQVLNFEWTSRQAAYDNEIGVYRVDDLQGRVNGLLPGDAGYAAAALSSSSRQVLFASGTDEGATTSATFAAGDLVAFYMISNDTTGEFLSRNPGNGSRGPHAFFSFLGANSDGVDHMRSVADSVTGTFIASWEDMYRGGDRDYNDVVITVTTTANANVEAGEAIRVPAGPAEEVPTTATLQPTRNAAGSDGPAPPSATEGEFGVYVVDDALGTVDGVAPGEAGYAEAVLGLPIGVETRQVLFEAGSSVGTGTTVNLPGFDLVGFYYRRGDTTVFSFDAANPGGVEHFRWFGPEGDGTSAPAGTNEGDLNLHVLDQLFGSDSDFDDFMISLDFGL